LNATVTFYPTARMVGIPATISVEGEVIDGHAVSVLMNTCSRKKIFPCG
jgi:hypothetical protein